MTTDEWYTELEKKLQPLVKGKGNITVTKIVEVSDSISYLEYV